MTNQNDKILAVVCIILLVSSIAVFSYIKTNEKSEDHIYGVLSATRDYTKDFNKYITADKLYGLISNDTTDDDPYIISIRSSTDYALGHIPGAINIPLSTLFTVENLENLPTDRQIVVYCYTGHTASQATALLNLNGYDTLSLKWGMCSWTTNSTVAANKYFTNDNDFDIVTGSEPGNWPSNSEVSFSPQASIRTVPMKDKPLTPLACGGDTAPPTETESDTSKESSESDAEALREASYNAARKTPYVIKAADLKAILDDGDKSNDPFILSVRSAEHYALGHIPGAINIGLGSLFTDENIAKLPKDKQIVVVCYTGHTASQTTALLNLNGYNATTLMWGMCSWTTDSTVTVSKCFNMTKDSHDYTFSSGIWDEDMRTMIYDSLNPMNPVAITAETLYNRINDTDTSNDPYILSIRSAEHYALGHITGAVKIGITSLFTEENLAKLPYD